MVKSSLGTRTGLCNGKNCSIQIRIVVSAFAPPVLSHFLACVSEPEKKPANLHVEEVATSDAGDGKNIVARRLSPYDGVHGGLVVYTRMAVCIHYGAHSKTNCVSRGFWPLQ